VKIFPDSPIPQYQKYVKNPVEIRRSVIVIEKIKKNDRTEHLTGIFKKG
jgi:hypothetical protein